MLSGGAARRLSGIAKPDLVVHGRTLLETAIAAARDAGAGTVVVVGPRRGSADRCVREDPPGGGPVPALRRGLAEITDGWTALLAADLPFLRGTHVAALLKAATGNGAVLADDHDRPQWLAGCWRVSALREALAPYTGDSLRGLMRPLAPALVRVDDGAWLDCDTESDVIRARFPRP